MFTKYKSGSKLVGTPRSEKIQIVVDESPLKNNFSTVNMVWASEYDVPKVLNIHTNLIYIYCLHG